MSNKNPVKIGAFATQYEGYAKIKRRHECALVLITTHTHHIFLTSYPVDMNAMMDNHKAAVWWSFFAYIVLVLGAHMKGS